MKKVICILKKEDANSLVENVIILPLIFIIIYGMIMTCFVVHDRSTVESAAKRGAIYASHCISDPNYSKIMENSGNEKGSLDTSINLKEKNVEFSFTNLGKNIQPYRYLTGSSTRINSTVVDEVRNIVDNTRIPWRSLDVNDVEFNCGNKLLYQDVTVSISADYPIPKFFGAFGFDTEYKYDVKAKMTVNDPDEFIRNADMAVDLITAVDDATGNHISKALDKLSELGTKILDWIKV